MAEQQPQPPSGFQRPGIPGAGNILDPEVRGELREQVHSAVHGARPAPAPAGQPDTVQKAEAPHAEPAAVPGAEAHEAPAAFRAGPFPHGDVDLRGLPANVPAGPIRPQRNRAGRKFYFIPASQAPDSNPIPESDSATRGPKPG